MIRITADKVHLAYLPTPLHELRNVLYGSKSPRLLIKRDDLTGLGLGGNKTRKLEYLIADAINKNANVIVTAGAAQSNHCRQTAAAAAMKNLKCVLLLSGEPQDHPNGNILLDHLFGASIVWTGTERYGESLGRISEKLCIAGFCPYVIPYGASNPLGALGYVEAMKETLLQLSAVGTAADYIILPTSSYGTQAGLIVGSALFEFRGTIIGVNVDKDHGEGKQLTLPIVDLCNKTAELIGFSHQFTEDNVYVDSKFTGRGYGIPDENEIDAIHLLASKEGILLDPVYSGRAMGALITMINNNFFSSDDTILFWHTGGVPSIFAYSDELYKSSGISDIIGNALI